MTAGTVSPAILDLSLDAIDVGDRHRWDMGDLQALAASMTTIGLLQPIGVTADLTLVFGERRLRAAQMLGWTTIAARIVDVPSIVAGEYAENEVRKNFTPSERVAIAEVVRAEIGSRQGRRTDQAQPVDRGPQVGPGEKTRDIAAQKAGFDSSHAYRLAKTVVERGAPNVVEAMDAGEVSISAAASFGTSDSLISRQRGFRDDMAWANPPVGKAGLREQAANRSSGTRNRTAQNCAPFRLQTGSPVSRNYAAMRACSQLYDKWNFCLSTTSGRLTSCASIRR
jgi:hypothetical protein